MTDEMTKIGEMSAEIYDGDEMAEVRIRFGGLFPLGRHPRTILSVVLSFIHAARESAEQCDCPRCQAYASFCRDAEPRLKGILGTSEVVERETDAIGRTEGTREILCWHPPAF